MNEQHINVYRISIPVKPLTNYDVDMYAKQLHIKNYRGNFMRDTLPKHILTIECGVINLDSIKNQGTHYVCYWKHNNTRVYFDSFGLPPAEEIIKYLGKPMQYNSTEIQERNSLICGHYCLYVLKSLSNGMTFQEVWESLI